ncbi:MAG: AI-2E family transporter [Candidatus Limnocylindrales bacterium]
MSDFTTEHETGRAPQMVPAWLVNLAALGWRVLVIVGFAVIAWFASTLIWNVVASIGLAIVVAVILAPLVLRLRASGRSRAAAAGIAWVVAIGAVLGLITVLVIALLPYLGDLLDRLREGQSDLASRVRDVRLPGEVNDLVTQTVTSLQLGGESLIEKIIGRVANLVGILVLATFLLFFFLKDGDKAWLWIFQSMPEEKRELISSTGDDALTGVGTYVRATAVTAAVVALTSLAFMLVVGTPLAVPLAILAFVLGFVPYFGGVIAGVLIVLVTLGADGTGAATIMAGLLITQAIVMWLVVQRRFFAGAPRLHPVVVLVVLPVGWQFGGLAGLILAVPLAAVGLSVGRAAIDILKPEGDVNLPEIVPSWLDRAAQWSWRAIIAILFVALLVVVLATIPLVLLPVILALILAATVAPLVGWLIGRGRSRGVATAVAVGGSTAAIVGVMTLSMVSLVRQAPELGRTATDGARAIDEAADGTLGLPAEAIEAGVDAGVGAIVGLGDELAAITVVVVLGVLLTFYFLRDGAGLWGSLMSHLPPDTAGELSTAGGRAFGVLGGYMVGTGAISFVGAFSQLVIMWVLNLPLALPIFVLSFFGGYIPYIGSALTTLMAFLVAVAVGDSIDIVVMFIWTIVFNIVQGNIVAPLVYNRTTDIHPAIVLAAIPAGSAVAGILGMFLVVPVLGVVATTWRSALRILGAEEDEIPGPPEPDAPDDDSVGRATSTSEEGVAEPEGA